MDINQNKNNDFIHHQNQNEFANFPNMYILQNKIVFNEELPCKKLQNGMKVNFYH